MGLVRTSDLRLSLRLLRLQPGLAILVVIGMAVGIGTATAAFAIVHGVFLGPLPVPDGERIVLVWDQHRTRGYNVYVTGEELAHRREHATAFERLAGFTSRMVLAEVRGGAAGPLRAAYITPNAFPLFGIAAALGRGLTEDDVRTSASPVVVIGHDVWRTRLGGRADVIGAEIRIAGEARTIVGVMPAGVRFPMREDLWIPASFTAESNRGSRLIVFGKLRPGVSWRQAEDELARLSQPRATPDNQLADLTQRVMPFTRGVGGPEQTVVLVAFSGVLILLLIVAAANVANLVLARNAVRVGEIALRTALGASRGQVVRLLLVESLVLSGLGGVLGLAGAYAGLVWFEGSMATLKSLPWWADVSVSPLVLAFLVLMTFLATAAIGLAPALKVTRASVSDVLKQHAGHIAGLRFGRLSATMVMTEFAIAVAFMGAAGTIGRGLLSFSFIDYQLPSDEVVVAQVYFGPAAVPEGATAEGRQRARERHYNDSMQRLHRIEAGLRERPGVHTVSVASAFPGNEVETAPIEIADASGSITTRVIEIGERYFETLDAQPTAGRNFLPAEHINAPQVAIVNEPFARRYLPGVNPVGHRVRLVSDDTRPASWLEIVGVVRDLGVNPGDPLRADAVYIPIAPTNVARVAVRTRTNPREITPLVLEVSHREAPTAQVQWIVSLAEQLEEVVAVFRRIGVALVAIGALALILSAASFYAIVSFTVTRRTREIGLRVALGASTRGVLQTVLRREVRQLAIGATLGLAGAMGLMQFVKQIPFDIQPAGIWLTGTFVAVMLLAGLFACTLPARRALSIEPMNALRHE